MSGPSFAHYAAPAAFLAAITVAALLVRAGFEQGAREPTTTPTVPTRAATTQATPGEQRPVRTYRVQSGDTFVSIAQKLGTTVVRLEQLNPGLDPTALHVGEKIRVQ